MDSELKEFWNQIRTGVVDVNDRQLFFPILLKGLIYDLNKHINVRGISVPHYILNTGDDIMYLEVKGQNQSIEPLQVSNENYIYNIIPRCIVQPSGVDIPVDQLSSPHTRGRFEVECDDLIYNFIAEYRRMPIHFTISLKYILDNFTDALQCTQQLISKLAFINNYNVTYLGQVIPCSYKIPENFETEKMIEFDGLTEEDKTRKINLDIELDSCFPVIYNKTIIPAEAYIKNMSMDHHFYDRLGAEDHEKHNME